MNIRRFGHHLRASSGCSPCGGVGFSRSNTLPPPAGHDAVLRSEILVTRFIDAVQIGSLIARSAKRECVLRTWEMEAAAAHMDSAFSVDAMTYASEVLHLCCNSAGPDRQTRWALLVASSSSRNLQMEYLDLYLIHMPVCQKPGPPVLPARREDALPFDFKGVWQAMEECQRLGLAKAIGVSNFTTKHLDKTM